MAQKIFDVGQGTLREIAQSLQEMKKMARSLESSASSLSILVDDERIKTELDQIEKDAGLAAITLQNIYKLIAREALKE